MDRKKIFKKLTKFLKFLFTRPIYITSKAKNCFENVNNTPRQDAEEYSGRNKLW